MFMPCINKELKDFTEYILLKIMHAEFAVLLQEHKIYLDDYYKANNLLK